MPSCMASPLQTEIFEDGHPAWETEPHPRNEKVRWKTCQKQLARDVSGRVQVRLVEESPSWEAWKRCHDVCLSRDGASCFREGVPPSFTPPHVLHPEEMPVLLPSAVSPLTILTELVLLRAYCKSGTGLTSCLPKRTGNATTYLDRMGRGA